MASADPAAIADFAYFATLASFADKCSLFS